MADLYAKIIGTASNYLYSYVLIILLVGGGIYFTIRTKGVQLRYLLESIRVILEPSDKDDESISAFQALMVSTASRVGTGNIAGISTAICFGGPGAIFWMWMTGDPRKCNRICRKYAGTDLQTPCRGRKLLRRSFLLY